MSRLVIVWIFTLGYALAASTDTIRNYEVNITLEASGEFTIAENILYDFGEEVGRHGIYRDIPPGGTVMGMHIDAGLKDFAVRMDGREVMWEQTIHGNMIRLKIGDKNDIVSGRHLYTITYRCTNGIVPSFSALTYGAVNKGKDVIHWNATGNQWEASILYAQVNLFLPPQLSSDVVEVEKPELKHGNRWVTKRHLSVESPGRLSIKIRFPQGILARDTAEILKKIKVYMAEEKAKFIADQKRIVQEKQEAREKRIADSLRYWIPLAFITLLLWATGMLVGKRSDRSLVVRYTPPSRLSVLQSGILLDKFADVADYSAAVLELAYLGYIVMEEDGEQTVLKRVKSKSNSTPPTRDQKDFLDALFDDNDTYVINGEEKKRQIGLGSAIADINNGLYTWAKREGYAVSNFAKLRSMASRVLFLIVMVSFLYASYIEVHQFPRESKFILLFAILFFLPGLIASLFRINILLKLSILVAGFGAGIMAMELPFWAKNDIAPIDIVTSPVAATFVLLMVAIQLYQNLGHLTRKGKKIHHHLKGLEHFITYAKEDEIRRRLDEDPHYVERLLPYAMLFGQIDHWLKTYDLMKLPAPEWNRASMGSISHIHISSITYSSGGSSSVGGGYSGGSFGGGGGGGGGFSGGGFGGGGGGSW